MRVDIARADEMHAYDPSGIGAAQILSDKRYRSVVAGLGKFYPR